MKRINDIESDYETFQNFLNVYFDGFNKVLNSTIEKQNEPSVKKIEEKKRL